MADEPGAPRFWSKWPAYATGAAALLTAVGSLVGGLAAAGVIGGGGQEADTATEQRTTAPTTSAEPVSFRRVSDESGAVSLTVPDNWTRRQIGFLDPDDLKGLLADGTGVLASPDTRGAVRTNNWTIPFANITVSRLLAERDALAALTLEQAVDRQRRRLLEVWNWSNECEEEGIAELSRAGLAGVVRRWTNCTRSGARIWDLLFVPPTRDYVVSMQLVGTGEQGRALMQEIVQTFEVDEALIPRRGDRVVP